MSRRTKWSIVESGVVVEVEMSRRFGCGGRFVDARVAARCLCGEKNSRNVERRRGRKREETDRVL